MRVLIDTMCLDSLCHPPKDKGLSKWLRELLIGTPDLEVVIPAVVAYELRRGYLFKTTDPDPGVRRSFSISIDRLDTLLDKWTHSEISRGVLFEAARLWATGRRKGHQNASNDRIDFDVIVAAQAITEEASVVTRNRRHFAPYGVRVLDPP